MMGMGFGVVGLLFMFLFWGGLIALAVLLVGALFPRGGRGTQSESDQSSDPHKIIDARYARGEITREQYELMKQDLSAIK